MLISASRRTDIPAFFSDWFFNRLHAGYILVRNPMNPRKVSKISLLPEVIDGIVFWTKNPSPMLPKLFELKSYNFSAQFTITPYGAEVEPSVPDKQSLIIPAFKALSDATGPGKITWRYDPIFLSDRYNHDYHLRAFEQLCQQLRGFTTSVTVSFLVPYRSILKNIAKLNADSNTFFTENTLTDTQLKLAETLAQIAQSHDITPNSCCDSRLLKVGFSPAKCVDGALFGLTIPRDKNQRESCNCSAAIDIGEYSTCRHGCVYCYANHSGKQLAAKSEAHDPLSPLLSGRLCDDDSVYERESISYRNQTQTSLF